MNSHMMHPIKRLIEDEYVSQKQPSVLGETVRKSRSIFSPIWSKIVAFFVITAFFATPGFSQPLEIDQTVEPGVILVQYEPGVYLGKAAYPSVLEIQSVEPAFPFLENLTGKRAQLASVQTLKQVFRVRYDADIPPHQAARMIENSPGVGYAEPEYRSFIDPVSAQVNRGLGTSETRSSLIPNDPMFSDEGYMQRMEMTKAWDIVRGEDGEVVIAIVDDGVNWEHPDLAANLWVNPGEVPDNGVDDDNNGFVDDVHGWNFYNNSNDSKPLAGTPNSHGTTVAGAAVAVANNNEGLAGTSWNATFMPINVADGPGSEFLNPDEGVLYAAANGAHIINASYGLGGGYSRTTGMVYQTAQDLGSLVVASAGNDEYRLGGYIGHYPSSFLSTLSVCGTFADSDRNEYNYGYSIDVCAAGTRVLTTSFSNEYGEYNGTSFAAPLVAGIAALVKTRFPEFTPQQIREQIRATADDKIYEANPRSYVGLLGRGYVNAYRAVTETDKVSIRLVEWEAADENDDDRLAISEQIDLTATFQSFLSDAENLTIELIARPGHMTFPNGNRLNLGAMRGGEKGSINFSVIPDVSAPYRSFIFIEPQIKTSEGELVSGGDAMELLVNGEQLALHETNTFRYTMTSEGNIGYVDFSDPKYHSAPATGGEMTVKGEEFAHQAGLLVGIASRVAGSVFSAPIREGGWGQNQDFVPANQLRIQEAQNGQQVSRVTMNDKSGNIHRGIDIIQESMVSSQDHFEDIALFRYRLRNQIDWVWEGLHVGLYFSIPVSNGIGMATYPNGSVEEMLPYMSMNISEGGYLGFVVLSDHAPRHYRTYDDRWSDGWQEVRLPREAWPGLSGGIIPGLESNGGDGQIFASGPHTLEALSEVVVEFAMIYGQDLDDLVENARRMHQLRDSWPIPSLITAPTVVKVMEGGSSRFDISLVAKPSSEITVKISGHEGTDLADMPPSPLSLTYTPTNYNTAQWVTLHAAEDEDIIDDEVTLTLTASGDGYEATHEVIVTITDNMTLDISESNLPQEVTLWGNYPNPLSDATNIEFDLPEPAQISVIVTDMLGRTVKILPYGRLGVGRAHAIEVNTADLISGLYYYTLRVDMGGEIVERSKPMIIVR